jgi:hypothetical protein
LKKALSSQLEEMKTQLLTALLQNNNKGSSSSVSFPPHLQAYHFLPSPTLTHHITLVYPLSLSSSSSRDPPPAGAAGEDSLATERQWWHQQLGLPMNRPLLKITNAITWLQSSSISPLSLHLSPNNNCATTNKNDNWKNGKLMNVHLGLPSPPSSLVKGEGGTIHMVQGPYVYFHYMQDGIDDNGWGCAYRSLQTIWSWFYEGKYTNVPPPLKHGEIQKVLVQRGERGVELLGSRQWIGALELGSVLNASLGIDFGVSVPLILSFASPMY